MVMQSVCHSTVERDGIMVVLVNREVKGPALGEMRRGKEGGGAV